MLPFGRLWYDTPDNAIRYAMHNSRSHDAVIRFYDGTGNVIETHELEKLPLGQGHLMSFELIPLGPLNPFRRLPGITPKPR